MKSGIHPLLLGATGVAAFTVSFLTGHYTGRERVPSASVAETAGRSGPQPPHVRPSGPPEDVKKEVESIRKASDRLGRMEQTIRLASSIPLQEITRWLDAQWFDVREGCEVRVFDTILRNRLIEGDLDAYMAWSAKSKRSDVKELLKSWASSDPQRLLDYFRAHPNVPLEIDLLIVMGKGHPKLALQRLGEILAAGNELKGNVGQLVEVLAASDPSGLAALESLMSPERKHWAELRIASEALKKGFAKDFRGLLDNPEGIAIYRNAWHEIPGSGNTLLDNLSILPAAWKSFIETNPYEFATTSDPERILHTNLEEAGFSAKGAQAMRECALREVSRQNPEKALELLDQFGFEPQQRREQLQGIIIGHSNEPERVQAMIASMGSEEDRAMAQSFIHPQPGSDPLRERTPQEWVQEASAAGLSILSYQARETLASWSREDIEALGSAFRGLPDDGKARAARLIVKECNRDDNDFQALKAEAVVYLASRSDLPPDPYNPLGTSKGEVSRQVEEWAATDATAAGDWVKALPEGGDRTGGEITLARVWMSDDPQEARRWIGSLAPADREKVMAAVEIK